MKKITLYVDVVSPFAYIAYHVLRASEKPAPIIFGHH